MSTIKKVSGRIASYDFFRGIISVGLIFFLTFFYFAPHQSEVEFFYRWASIGFIFFSGLLVGESLFKKKNKKYFIRRGLQILGIFFFINIALLFPSGESFSDFSLSVIRGDYMLVLPLLLPFGIVFLVIPLLSYIPIFLGISWSILLFILLDIFSFQKNFLSLNAFLCIVGILGFFAGRLFSLEKIRDIWNRNFVVLPFLSLYISLGVLLLGDIFLPQYFSIISQFWSFHFLILLLFYFSIPSSLFRSLPNMPRSDLRKFLEPLGVEILFIYILVTLIFEAVIFFIPQIIITNFLILSILGIHIVIFCFLFILVLQKLFRKHKKIRKMFRFIF